MNAEIRMIADVARSQAAERPAAAALVFESRRTTWSALDAGASRTANALIAAGVGPGTRVATLAQDSDDLYEALLGIAKARGVITGINWRLAAPEVRFILDDAEVEVLLVGPDAYATVEATEDQLEGVRTIVALGEHDRWTHYRAWRDAQPPSDPDLGGSEDDVVVQMYTSGTTGRPKGVMLANRSFFAVVRSMQEAGDPWIGWSAEDVSLYAFPSFHIGGLWWAMTSMAAGATSVIVPAFVAWRALQLIQEMRVTKTCMVPAMIQMLLAEPDCRETDFSSLDHVVYGGSPIPVPVLEEALATFRCGFAQIYGLTETGNTAVCLRPADHEREELLSAAGRPYPGVEARVIDASGRAVGPRAIGEICLKSPANMVGYWKREEATRKTLLDGWIHTGDAGFIDEEGYVFVCDRVKDMIISAGENIYPAEIESALCGHAAVAEAAVIGVPDDRWGELVKAVVVLKPDASATAADLIAHVRGELAAFKVPRSVDFVDALPRTPSGKVKKGELREPYWKGRSRRV